MADAAQKPHFGVELPAVRRFELADISRHAKWLLPRFVKQYPHLTERTALGFLNSVLYSPEFFFCYQPNAVGLAQVERTHSLSAQALIREKFVWVQDPKDESQIDEALAFYTEFRRWGEQQGATIMIVEESSDVPHNKITDLFTGTRVFTREQKFVRLG